MFPDDGIDNESIQTKSLNSDVKDGGSPSPAVPGVPGFPAAPAKSNIIH